MDESKVVKMIYEVRHLMEIGSQHPNAIVVLKLQGEDEYGLYYPAKHNFYDMLCLISLGTDRRIKDFYVRGFDKYDEPSDVKVDYEIIRIDSDEYNRILRESYNLIWPLFQSSTAYIAMHPLVIQLGNQVNVEPNIIDCLGLTESTIDMLFKQRLQIEKAYDTKWNRFVVLTNEPYLLKNSASNPFSDCAIWHGYTFLDRGTATKYLHLAEVSGATAKTIVLPNNAVRSTLWFVLLVRDLKVKKLSNQV